MRKVVKIIHTIASCGLIGGTATYMVLLGIEPEFGTEQYTTNRGAIAAIANYILLPSLAFVLISGLVAMVVHKPYLHKGWVGVKALLGILMFKGVLTLIGSSANRGLAIAEQSSLGNATPDAVESSTGLEWGMLTIILAISIANIVLGVWRPKIGRSHIGASSKQRTAP